MPNLKQRLESLEQSLAADGYMSHAERVDWLNKLAKSPSPSDAAKPPMTKEEFDAAFARMENKWRCYGCLPAHGQGIETVER